MNEFFKILRRFVPPYKKYLILNIIFNILAAILTLFSFAIIIPILEMLFQIKEASYTYMTLADGSFKDVVINNFYYYTQVVIDEWGASYALAGLAALLIFMTFLKTGVTYLSLYFIVPMRSGIVRDIRNYVYDKITTLPISFFTSERKGDVMARMSGDVAEIENSIMASLDMMFKNPVMIIVCLGMMITISWQLTVFVLILLPLAGIVMGRVGKKLKRKSLEGQQQWGTLMSNIEETLGGLRIIKAFIAEDKMRERFANTANEYKKASGRVAMRQASAHPVSEFLGSVMIMIVLWFGGTLILSDKAPIDAPTFIFYMTILYSVLAPLKEFSRASYNIPKGLASMERVDKIMDAENEIKESENPKDIDGFNESLRFNNVSFSYEEGKEILHKVNLEIPKGKTIALVGQSGSGKSTLMQQLNGLLKPTSGKVLLDGQDIWSDKKLTRQARFRVGLVFQYPEYQLFEETVYKDIAFGPKNMGLKPEEIDRRVREAAGFVGLTEQQLEVSPFDLSGGQKRRVAIAGVIAMEPEVLILDEPTAGLDPSGREEILGNIEAYRKAKNATIMMVSHSMEDVARLTDRLLVMCGSRLAMDGTPKEVFIRAQELVDMGLSIPQVTQVFLRLQQLGLDVEPVYTIDQAVQALKKIRGGAVHA